MSSIIRDFDVAFLPINSRLIRLSETLAKPLENRGVTTCILKTALQGRELSGWDEMSDLTIPVVPVKSLWFEKKSNFFSYTVRAVKSIRALKEGFLLPSKVLVVFMDTYAEGEILINVAKSQNVHVILFQEGFHVRTVKYSKNLYGLACYLRSRLLPRYFTGLNDGLYADSVALWSQHGMRDDLIEKGRAVESIHVVGNPLPLVVKNARVHPLPLQPSVLIIHQPLSPRYSSKKWEQHLYSRLVADLVGSGYKVLFKPHPRVISNGALEQLRQKINISLDNEKMVDYIARDVIAEDLLSRCSALITPISVTAYTSLRMGIPTIFVRTPRIVNKLLVDMHELNEIHYLSDPSNIVTAIDNILKDNNSRELWFKKGPQAAKKLSGSSEDFNTLWSKCVEELT